MPRDWQFYVYLVASRTGDAKRAEILCMYVDAALLGAWSGALQFPIWITYAAFFSTTLNAIAITGIPYEPPLCVHSPPSTT